ncbi:PucR family transcriptional regulator [Anaerorhabdus sp.]|uniref:PucR family transcriptional regulator n=1 Tax=Anaerorhabdus sp. TaxID=1872524 RepID=UPI002FC6542D
MSKYLNDLLQDYTNQFQCSLRCLVKQGEVLFEVGKLTNEANRCEFEFNHMTYVLESVELSEKDLKLISLACMQCLKNEIKTKSNEDILAIALRQELTHLDQRQLTNAFNCEWYGLMLIVDPHNRNDEILDLVKQLSQYYLCVTRVENQLLILMNWEDIEQATIIQQSLESELYILSKVYTSRKITDLSEISSSYDNLCEIKRLATVFYPNKVIIKESDLSLVYTINKLTKAETEKILAETNQEGLKLLDDLENKKMIQVFFDNNLNLAETARQLYIHRNTLIYRLDKLTEVLGLDIRKFDDAFQLSYLMMLMQHVKSTKKLG